jgi:hypothetical protein
MTRLCERRVQALIKEVIALGELKIEFPGGGRRSNRFQIQLQALHRGKDCGAPGQPAAPQGGKDFGAPGQPTAPNPSSNRKRTIKERVEGRSKALPESIAQILSAEPVELVFDRNDWLGSLERLLGPKEWKQCGAMWRMRARGSPEDALALRNAIEDFFVKTPEQRNEINNRGAWLTDRYERNAKQMKQR